MRRSLPLIALALALAACDDAVPEQPPEQPPEDAARDAARDATRDAGQDAGQDATRDAGQDATPDAAPDAGPGPAPHTADCAEAPSPGLRFQPAGCAHEAILPEGIRALRQSCGAADAPPEHIHLTFPGNDPSTAVAVQWITPASTQHTVVSLGERPDALDQTFYGHSFTYQGLTDRRVHQVHLCGLTPGRTYFYRVGPPDQAGEPGQFTTAPPRDSDEEYTLAIAGDTRTFGVNYLWQEALQSITAHGADALLFSGDAVELGLVQPQWDDWFTSGGAALRGLPIIPTNGNHDLLTINYLSLFALPEGGENFHYRYGDALIISLNDFVQRDREAIPGRTRQYLQDTLEAHRDARWKFVMHHRAIYSASNHGSTERLQTHWRPLYDAHEVDFVFNGHDHNYERTHPLRDDAIAPDGKGTYYVIAAGIGAPLYGNGREWWTAVSERTSSYAILRISGQRATLTAYRLDGTVIDEVTVEK